MANGLVVSLNDVRFFSRIGVLEQERKVGNEFEVNLEIHIPTTDGMRQDKISGTVSYADLFDEVQKVMNCKSQTLEYVALTIVDHLKKRWPQIYAGKIAITKVAPPIVGFSGSASVTVEF